MNFDWKGCLLKWQIIKKPDEDDIVRIKPTFTVITVYVDVTVQDTLERVYCITKLNRKSRKNIDLQQHTLNKANYDIW